MKEVLAKKYASILDDPEAFHHSIQQPLPGVFWWNPARGHPERLLTWLQEHGITATPLGWHPNAWRVDASVSLGNTLPHIAGWCCIQEEVALTAVRALAPEPGEIICDMCASPGGKTAQISVAVGPTGGVVANEKSLQRLSALGSKIDNMGLTNVTVTHADGAALSLHPASFDRVLVDVPCSGEGTVRKFKGGHRPISGRFLEVLPKVQEQILRRALRLVKPGGVVVYSTCTFNPDENEAVLNCSLRDLGVVEPFDIPGFPGSPGLTSWNGAEFRADIVHARRYYPHVNDTGGFFVARIRRTDVVYRRDQGPHESIPSLFTEIDLEERARILRWLLQRYDIAPEQMEGFRFVGKGRHIRIITPHCPEADALVSTRGVAGFERTARGYILMAYGAQLLGSLIKRNLIELQTQEELTTYLAGKPLSLSRYADLKGIVVVGFGEYILGKGSILDGQLDSQLPRFLRLEIPELLK